jgi:hypothetical protein
MRAPSFAMREWHKRSARHRRCFRKIGNSDRDLEVQSAGNEMRQSNLDDTFGMRDGLAVEDEFELVTKAKNGSGRAAEQLVVRYQGRVFRTARKITRITKMLKRLYKMFS